MSPAWGGSSRIYKFLATGDNNGIVYLKGIDLREVLRSWESLIWLLPYRAAYGKDEVIVRTPFYNYTVYDNEKFLEDIKYEYGKEILARLADYREIKDPKVTVYPLYAVGKDTPYKFDYDARYRGVAEYFRKPDVNTIFDFEPEKSYEAGDGSVPKRTLDLGDKWEKTILLPGYQSETDDHNSILANPVYL